MSGHVDYRTDLFDPASMELLAARLVRVLESVTTDPDLPVSQIDVLGDTERHQVLTQWNDTAHPLPDALLPELFEAQVERTPDAVAVVFEGQEVSYGELNGRVNRLARYLIGRGPGRNGWWRWRCHARPNWSSPCWPSSKPARDTSPSTRTTPPTVSTTCSRTRPPHSWSPTPPPHPPSPDTEPAPHRTRRTGHPCRNHGADQCGCRGC
ncbi:AMP-binding protein [Streptomyces sp. FXJ1.4098]|nr:AMP-binding protein [Streptomyces sp. FXJ1.4098]